MWVGVMVEDTLMLKGVEVIESNCVSRDSKGMMQMVVWFQQLQTL